jgi:hypothetical protein
VAFLHCSSVISGSSLVSISCRFISSLRGIPVWAGFFGPTTFGATRKSQLWHRIGGVPQTFPCPCCGNLTLGEQPPGTYWNCEVCGWEDHPGTLEDLELVCGTNGVGLRQARENYQNLGASDGWLIPKVRKPLPEELPGISN